MSHDTNCVNPLLRELVQSENLSWEIGAGLALGDSGDFDYWLMRFWRDGKPDPEHLEAPPQLTLERPGEGNTIQWWDRGTHIIGFWRYLRGYYLVPISQLTDIPRIVNYA